MKNFMKFFFLILINIFAGFVALAQTEACDLVEVRSELEYPVADQVKIFRQIGVGWVVDGKEKDLWILTPAHVVDGATRTQIRCRGKVLQASLWISSPTLDLALLRISSTQSEISLLKPLLSLTDVLPDMENGGSARVRVINPQRKKYYYSTVSSPIYRIKNPGGHPLLGVMQAIQLDVLGVRPGMSGSPVFDFKDQRHPMGMIVKTLNNSSMSLAISITDIKNILPGLFDQKDPIVVNKQPRVIFTWEWDDVHQSLVRKRRLYLEKTERYFEEQCPSGSLYSQTSDWVPVSPKTRSAVATGDSASDVSDDWGDGGGDWGDGSGDWGDGSQEAFVSPDNPSSGEYSGLPDYGGPMDFRNGIMYSIYKKNLYCSEEGIKTPDGRVLVSVVNPMNREYLRVDSISDIYTIALRENENLEKYLGEFGNFYAPRTTPPKQNVIKKLWKSIWGSGAPLSSYTSAGFSDICRTDILGKDLSVQQRGGMGGSIPLIIQGKRRVYFHRERLLEPTSDRDVMGLVCSAGGKEIHLYDGIWEQESSSGQLFVLMDLRIRPGFLSGKVQVGRCAIELKNQKVKYYGDVLEGKHGLKLTYAIWPSEKSIEVHLNVINFPEECHVGPGAPPWLMTFKNIIGTTE